MTDNVCYSILKTATQQIIQSAGFEAANNSSIDTLADVFGKYMELLGSTCSAYANLNGRTIGNSYDLMKALNEVDMEPKKLKSWLEEEGKLLLPCWSDQSDPGRLIQGVINGGKPDFEDLIEYRFGKKVVEYDVLSPTSNETPPSVNEQEELNNLPDYIPSYFPPFPEVKQDEIMEEVSFQAQQKILQQKKEEEIQQQQQQQQQQLPVLVKNRKKPIENPFTHIIPFEDSSLTTDSEDGQQQPLSLLVDVNMKRRSESEEEEQEKVAKRRKNATSSLLDALSKIKPPKYKLGEGLIGKNEELFRNQTENAAAPGNYLFNHDIGVFDQVIRSIADPMVISKLTCPNLQTDIAVINTPNLPPSQNPFQDSRSSPGPTSPERSSMLAALAGGGVSSLKKSGLKKLSSQSLSHMPSNPMSLSSLSNQTISKHSVDINAIKTGDSKYIIKKKRMLLEKQQMLERQQQQQQQQDKGFPTTSTSQPIGNQVTKVNNNTPTTTTPVNNVANNNISTPSSSSSSSSSVVHNTINPVKLTATHTTIKHTNNNHNNTNNNTIQTSIPPKPKTLGPISLSSFSSSSPSSSATPSIHEDVSSSNTPKIRFKIKPPEQQPTQLTPAPPPPQQQQQRQPTTPQRQPTTPQKQVTIQQSQVIPQRLPPPTSNFSHNNGYNAEEIRCICENPTVDYGTFMIACDNCSVWFHGSCVNIAESDQVEEWYCKRCRR